MTHGLKILFTVLQIVVMLGMLVPTIFTLVPHQASKVNRLGYFSYCAFAPYSTLSMLGITLLLLGIIYWIRSVLLA